MGHSCCSKRLAAAASSCRVDLSVVGFDNAPEAAHSELPLTTIAQDAVAKGRAAARLLLEGGPPRHVVLPVELIVRGSTAPPRA